MDKLKNKPLTKETCRHSRVTKCPHHQLENVLSKMKIVIEGTRSEQMQQIKGYWTEDYDEK